MSPRFSLLPHPLRPTLALSARPQEDRRQLLHVLTRMVRIDNASPLQGAPGTARVGHLLQHALVVSAGVIPIISAIDQAQPVAIDLPEDGLEQRGSLGGQGSLPRLRHVAQIHCPHTFPTAVQH